MEADKDSIQSDVESITTDDALQLEIDEAFATQEQSQQPTLDLRNPNPSPDPESTAEPPKDKGKGEERCYLMCLHINALSLAKKRKGYAA